MFALATCFCCKWGLILDSTLDFTMDSALDLTLDLDLTLILTLDLTLDLTLELTQLDCERKKIINQCFFILSSEILNHASMKVMEAEKQKTDSEAYF